MKIKSENSCKIIKCININIKKYIYKFNIKF